MKLTTTLLLLSFFLVTDAATQESESETFQVVVNVANPMTSASTTFLSVLFLKKKTLWDHGGKVLPVDQLKSSALRESFSETVHGKDVRAIESYWQSRLFSGRATPPPELSTDAEVLSYIERHAAAIGYVSKNAALGNGVRVVAISP